MPGTAHGRARVSSSRRNGWKTGSPLSSVPLGSLANSTCRSGRLVDVGDASTARSRWRGSRRTAGRPGCGRSWRCARHPSRRRKQSAGVWGATIGTGRLAVAAEHRLEQVGLLGLGGQAGGGAAALHVDDDQGQLERDGQPDRLGLQGDARAARGGDADRAAEAGAERDADAGDLVLGLHGRDAVPLERGQGVQDVGGRGDRVRAEHEGEAGAVRGGDQAQRERGVAGDVAVGAGRHLRGGDDVGRRRSPRWSRRSSSRRAGPRGWPRGCRGGRRTSW